MHTMVMNLLYKYFNGQAWERAYNKIDTVMDKILATKVLTLNMRIRFVAYKNSVV